MILSAPLNIWQNLIRGQEVHFSAFNIIKPVFSDHLSYMTIFNVHVGRQHKTVLTVVSSPSNVIRFVQWWGVLATTDVIRFVQWWGVLATTDVIRFVQWWGVHVLATRTNLITLLGELTTVKTVLCCLPTWTLKIVI
jgi:hypothetical protein